MQRNTETEESLAKRPAAPRADMESSGVRALSRRLPWALLTPQECQSQPRGAGGWSHHPAPWSPRLVLTPLCSWSSLTLPPPPGKEPGLFDLIIVNDSLDKAYWALEGGALRGGLGWEGLRHLCGKRVQQAGTGDKGGPRPWAGSSFLSLSLGRK